jgi:hypothetical protein
MNGPPNNIVPLSRLFYSMHFIYPDCLDTREFHLDERISFDKTPTMFSVLLIKKN